MTRYFSRTDKSPLGRWWWTVDRAMLFAVVILAVCGIVLVSAASPSVASRIGLDPDYFVRHHVMMLVPAFAIMLGVSLLSPRNLWRLSSVVLVLGLLGMIAVLIVGTEIKGARRWLHFPLLGSIQPSEFIKPAFAVAAAWLMAKEKEAPEFRGTAAAAGLWAVIAVLLMAQPDFGMTCVLTAIFAGQLVLAGLPLIWLAWLFGAGIVASVAVYFLFGHVHDRVDRFLFPAAGDNYQVLKALDAFREGGFAGTGLGQGTVKLSLPDAHADFIFAVAGDEMGFLLAAFLVLIFAFIVLRGLNRIMDSEDIFTVLATGGLLTQFGLQAIIHMGSNLHLIPAKGMTLPFVSYGGSSLLSVALGMGMILGLTRRPTGPGAARGNAIARGGLTAGGA